MAQKQGASLKPSDQTAGGLMDDVNVKWEGCEFVLWDYNGTVSPPVPALVAELVDLDDDGRNKQYWSAGSSRDWVPSGDGKRLVAVGSATGLRSSSNAAILLASLVNSGFPEDRIEDDVSVFDGLECHVIRIPAPKRAGLEKAPRADGREFESTILTVDEITKLPWEKGTKKAGVTGVPKPPAKTAKKAETEGADEDLDEKALALVMEIIGEAGGEVGKNDLPALALKKLKSDPQRNLVVQRVFQDDFLSNGPWSYESGKLSM